jgi:undecaprenyl pyrophosphate phosphatase UppP
LYAGFFVVLFATYFLIAWLAGLVGRSQWAPLAIFPAIVGVVIYMRVVFRRAFFKRAE